MKRPILTALGLLALIATPVLAAGLWPTLPLLGGAAVCSSTSTGVSGQVCTTTTPAGPSSVTGSETIPADTNLSQGRSPQSVRMPMAAFNALPFTYATITQGATTNAITTLSTDGGVIIIGSAALTGTTTVLLPPSPIDGQQFALSSTQSLTTLTISAPGGASVSNNPTAMTASTTASYGYRFKYRATGTTWYRTQ